MSGMNSGLDTESIINALTANTKLKATKQERSVLKYEATQEAYRDIISKMQGLKNKYFDILNKDSYIAGNTMWNKYSSKVYDSAGTEAAMSGITVQTTINSNPGEYKVNVNKTAKQAQLKGNSLSTKAKIDTDSLESGKEYGFSITVGDTEKTIKFTAGDNSAATINAINDKLEEEFGESNDSVGSSGNKGMVYVDDSGQIVSRSGKGVTMSGIGTLKENFTVLQPVRSFIYFTDQAQRAHISDPFPVNGIRHFGSFFIILLVYQFVDLFQFEIVFILIHFCHLLRKVPQFD